MCHGQSFLPIRNTPRQPVLPCGDPEISTRGDSALVNVQCLFFGKCLFFGSCLASQRVLPEWRQLITHSGIASCQIECQKTKRNQFSVNRRQSGRLDLRNFHDTGYPSVKIRGSIAAVILKIAIDLQGSPQMGLPSQLFVFEIFYHARKYRPTSALSHAHNHAACVIRFLGRNARFRSTRIFGEIRFTGRRQTATSTTPRSTDSGMSGRQAVRSMTGFGDGSRNIRPF